MKIMRRTRTGEIALLLGLTAAAAGCASAHRASTPPGRGEVAARHAARVALVARGRPDAASPLLISFHRVFGTDPMAQTLTVRADGQSQATVGYGGRNGLRVVNFDLAAGQLRALRAALAHTHLRTTGLGNDRQFIYWLITDRGSFRLSEVLTPPSARPLIDHLNALTDVHTGWSSGPAARR